VLNTVFTDTGLRELRLACIVTDNEHVEYQPVPCSSEESSALLSSLHGGLVADGNGARLVLQPGRGVVGTPVPSLS
jgi:hypothetical protein